MSVKYIPVQWNRNKWFYDGVLAVAVLVFLAFFLFLTPELLNHERQADKSIQNARAFGLCAFLMLTVILCIGPLARLDRRFLPLLYNRRHFGVMTVFVALTHAGYIVNWYFNFSHVDKFQAVLSSNLSFTQLIGFPFEILGVFSLLVLLLLSTTSHDFWIKFLTAPVWKRLHYLIYPAYAALVGHIALGILQDNHQPALMWFFVISVGTVIFLHLFTAFKETFSGDKETVMMDDWNKEDGDYWEAVCKPEEIAEGFARIAKLSNGDRVAVFKHQGKLSAISNACAHQHGPLGEGKIIQCLVTCPWHGFQYDLTNGRSPAPFTEKVPTYNLVITNGTVRVNPQANPPGTFVEPVIVNTIDGQATL